MPLPNPGLPAPPEEDTGVELALWGPTHASSFLYTGSSDGVVKVWDVKRADPFVRDLVKMDAQIMCGAWAPGGGMLAVGDTSGAAMVLSTFGEAGGEGGVRQFRIEGEVLPEGGGAGGSSSGGGGGGRSGRGRSGSAGVDASELGRYYSRELVRTGKVVIGHGIMGYGAYGA